MTHILSQTQMTPTSMQEVFLQNSPISIDQPPARTPWKLWELKGGLNLRGDVGMPNLCVELHLGWVVPVRQCQLLKLWRDWLWSGRQSQSWVKQNIRLAGTLQNALFWQTAAVAQNPSQFRPKDSTGIRITVYSMSPKPRASEDNRCYNRCYNRSQ